MPLGYRSGSGASGSKKSLFNKSLIDPVGAVVAVPPSFPARASANKIPSSEV